MCRWSTQRHWPGTPWNSQRRLWCSSHPCPVGGPPPPAGLLPGCSSPPLTHPDWNTHTWLLSQSYIHTVTQPLTQTTTHAGTHAHTHTHTHTCTLTHPLTDTDTHTIWHSCLAQSFPGIFIPAVWKWCVCACASVYYVSMCNVYVCMGWGCRGGVGACTCVTSFAGNSALIVLHINVKE